MNTISYKLTTMHGLLFRKARLGMFLVAFMSLACLIASADAASPKDGTKQVKVIMVDWRGETEAEKGFRKELALLGYAPQYKQYSCSQDPAKLAEIVKSIALQKPDLIYTFGTTVTLAVTKQVHDIPIVFSIVSNPDKTGIMKTLDGSGRNVAGATHAVSESAIIDALLRVIPAKKIGILYNPAEVNSQISKDRFQALCAKSGVSFEERALRFGDDPAKAARELVKKGVEAVILPSDSLVVSQGATIIQVFNDAGIPTVGALEPYVLKQGALFGLTTSYADVGRSAASLADRIFKGEDPGKMPLAFVRPSYVVNLQTAKRLGVKLPKDMIGSARKVIK